MREAVRRREIRRPSYYVEGELAAAAIEVLNAYYRPVGGFDGRYFDQLAATADPFQFTPADLLAVRMLSVEVPPDVAMWLLGDGQAETASLLKAIPAEAAIWDAGDLLCRGSAAWELWDFLHGMTGLGDTTTSKLLAAKRPQLIPIWDSVVGKALFGNDVNGYWESWVSWFAGDNGKVLRSAYEGLRKSAEVPAFVSTLRLVDVVVWMHHKVARESDINPTTMA